MNLNETLSSLTNGETILLENKIYHIWQEDCPLLSGYYFSNTTSLEENPNGNHRAAIYLRNKKNITIDGNGATLLIHGVVTPLIFDNCENITIKNLTIDYARPTMSEFLIEKKEGKKYTLYIPPEFLFELRGNDLIWLGEKNSQGVRYWKIPYRNFNVLSMYYDPVNEKICNMMYEEDDSQPSVPKFSCAERIDETHICVELEKDDAFFPIGCTVQTRRIGRNETGAGFLYCKDLHMENVRICAMNGFGLLSQFCENITYNGVDCTPKAGRTVASNADFFHFSGCKGNVLIENCKAAGGHDDFINVHGTHLRIFNYDKESKKLLVRFMHEQSCGFKAFFVGDKIELIKWDTLLPYATATVVAVNHVNLTDIELTVDGVLPEIELGKDVVENATWTAQLTVRNNYFGCSGVRGVLCTTRKPVLIENNVFYHVSGVPLLLEDDCNFWFESGYTTDVVFKNNKVIGCGYGFENKGEAIIQVTPKVLNENTKIPVHKKLVIKNNSFSDANPLGHYMNFEYIDTVVLSKNVFDTHYIITKKCVNNFIEQENFVKDKN